jgi:ferredoxin
VTLEQQITSVFEKCIPNNCLETTDLDIFEVLDEGKSKIVPESQGQFKIINPNKEPLYFLAIDKCIFFDEKDPKRCDFAIFSEDIFVFVELKECKGKNRRENAGKAIKQLEETLKQFKNKISLPSKLFAIASITRKKTTNNTQNEERLSEIEKDLFKPLSVSKKQSKTKSFKDDYQATLLEDSKCDFSELKEFRMSDIQTRNASG